MSVWQWMGEAAESGAGALGAFIDWAAGFVAGIGDPETRRQVAFSVALIALSAKMAKADGVVTAEEVRVFRGVFAVPAGEQRNVARLFDLARADIAGYDAYARRIRILLGEDRRSLEDVVEGLFVIAKADGVVHEAELAYLESVAAIFGLGADFERIAARHVVPEEGDPYLALGAGRDWPMARLRAHYRKLVRENHPDRMIAAGLPEDFIAIANDRLAVINRAFERIEMERARG